MHLGSHEMALYVIDALGPERKGAVERHLFACDACAEGVAREARIEAALEQVAQRSVAQRTARGAAAPADGLVARSLAEANAVALSRTARVHLVTGGRRTRWAGGIGGALAAAAALVLAFASTTARSEPAGVAQRAPVLHDAAGDMSGAFGIETVSGDTLDGG